MSHIKRYPKEQQTAEFWVNKNQLHVDDISTFNNCRDLAFMISRRFKLGLKELRPQKRFDKGALGRCYVEERRLQVAFRNKYPRNLDAWIYSITEEEAKLKRGNWFDEAIDYKDFQCGLKRGHVIHTVEQVTIHEVAHLKHPNHSKKFWNFVHKIERMFI